MTKLKPICHTFIFGCLLSSASLLAVDNQVFDLAPITVTGDLLQTSVDRLPASVTVIGSEVADTSGIVHFEDLIGRMPNLNWAGGTSRPRFFQIRGIGENSQFGNELPASSVGFMIDGIDFTGIGMAAGLFDLSQVEVLRGPQAAAFGANALAGMVLMETAAPTRTTQGKIETTIGDHDLYGIGAAAGGSIGDNGKSPLAYRISVHHREDNGFRENTFLGRNDTNGRDENTARIKLNYAPADSLELDLTLLYFDYNNGYDPWSLTNDSFVTSTDEPGMDNQETRAAGLRATWHPTDNLDVSYRGSITSSDLYYGYDWDWSNIEELMQVYGPEVYWGVDITERTRTVSSHDLRFNSSQTNSASTVVWAAGLYQRDFEETQLYFGVNSTYTTETRAAYGQARISLNEAISATMAGRVEDFQLDYADEFGTQLGSTESPWGGKLALEILLTPESLLYAAIDRGFKVGGVNLDDEVPEDSKVYGTETLLNYEMGWRSFFLEKRLHVQVTAFYMDRQDIQVDSSIQLGDGNTFALYKDNAASGHNYGIEFELDWRLNDNLRFFANFGLLKTRFDQYRYIDPSDGQTEIVLDGKEQGYAPNFNYAIGAEYRMDNGFFFNASIEGKDSYLFDVTNNQSLAGYNLVRLRLGYDHEQWRFTLWINNALDERYDTRGFFFANEPPYYDAPKKWVSEGAPRQIGVSIRRAF